MEFEADVWSKLILVVIDPTTLIASMKVNTTYNYSIVKIALFETQKEIDWINNVKVQKLTFSAGYIHDFLKRQKFRRRKITAVASKKPT